MPSLSWSLDLLEKVWLKPTAGPRTLLGCLDQRLFMSLAKQEAALRGPGELRLESRWGWGAFADVRLEVGDICTRTVARRGLPGLRAVNTELRAVADHHQTSSHTADHKHSPEPERDDAFPPEMSPPAPSTGKGQHLPVKKATLRVRDGRADTEGSIRSREVSN